MTNSKALIVLKRREPRLWYGPRRSVVYHEVRPAILFFLALEYTQAPGEPAQYLLARMEFFTFCMGPAERHVPVIR